MTKNAIGALAYAAVLATGHCWLFAFAYADWLRFVSPRTPNPATGQVVFMKAVKGVFYITSRQAWWTEGILPYIAAVALTSVIVLLLLRAKDGKNGNTDAPDTKIEDWAYLIAGVMLLSYIVVAPSLLWLGDNVMQLLFTGSPILPPAPH
jgi:hypothetical protein